MKIYSGKLELVGDGTVQHNKMGPSRTTRAVIEIGEHTLRNVKTDNYIESYLRVGEEMKILVARFLWIKAILGVHINGKSYKASKGNIYFDIFPASVFIVLVYAGLASSVGFIGHIIGLGLIVYYIRFKARAIKQFNRF
ncbi:MAG: hypothetical protein RIM99_01375 [Cyclobacteriaceae bacterium]